MRTAFEDCSIIFTPGNSSHYDVKFGAGSCPQKNEAAAAEKAVYQVIGSKAYPLQVKETCYHNYPCFTSLCSGNMGALDTFTDGNLCGGLCVPSQTCSLGGGHGVPSKAPVTLLALLQTAAASEWQQTIRDDLTTLRAHLPKLLEALPDPKEDPVQWLRLEYNFPKQWKQLMRRVLKAAVAEQEATFMLGYKEISDLPSSTYDSVEQPIKCPDCENYFQPRRAVIMHGRREHGTAAAAARFVANAWCQSCRKKFRSNKSIIHQLQYGALARRLMVASGNMLQPDPEKVEAFRQSEASARACDSRKGRGHTVGFPAFSL